MALAKFYEDLIEKKFETAINSISRNSVSGDIDKINLSQALAELNTLKKVLINEIKEIQTGSETEINLNLKIEELTNSIYRLEKNNKELVSQNKKLESKFKHQIMLNKYGDQHEKKLSSQLNKLKKLIDEGNFQSLTKYTNQSNGHGLVIELDNNRKMGFVLFSAGEFYFNNKDLKKIDFDDLNIGDKVKFTITSTPNGNKPGKLTNLQKK